MREKYAMLLAGWIFSAVCVSGVCQAGVPKDGHGTAAVETTAEDLLPGMSDEMPPVPPADGKGPGPGDQGQEARSADDLQAACVVDKSSKTLQGQKLTTAKADENALLVRNGGSLVLQDAVLQKTGDSTRVDDSNFSGCNAIVLSSNSTIKLRQVELASAAEGANAIFSTGKNSQIVADHVKIHTTAGSSRGLDATYGGTITASDVDIVTEGAHCAALATDRGEGTVTVSRGTLMTFGEGSPCVYSTGAIRAVDSRGIASRSEIAVVEGKNSIELQNVELTGSVKHGVMLYQSFSGDAGTGTASFKATGSRLTNLSTGPMFYVTNTKAQAQLENELSLISELHYEHYLKHQGVRHPRTAVAVTKEGRLLLITVDGRNAKALGMSAKELTKFLVRYFNPKGAMNIDGGGSTMMWVKGQVPNGIVNYPTDNKKFDHYGQRRVETALFIK